MLESLSNLALEIVAIIFLFSTPLVWPRLLERLEKAGWISGIVIAIFSLISFAIPNIPEAYKIIGVIIGISVIVISFLASKDKKETPIQVELKYPETKPEIELSLRPLIHYKGELTLPAITEKGEVIPPKPTTTEFNLLAESQYIAIGKGKVAIKDSSEFYLAKFGVIRVRAVRGDVINCKVDVSYRVTDIFGEKYNESFRFAGPLDWFSLPLRNELTMKYNEIDRLRMKGIGDFIRNPKESLFQSEEKDLEVFYMIKGLPSVHLCTEASPMIIGYASEGKPVKFELELAVMAEKYARKVFKFEGSAEWDDFHLKQVVDKI